MGWDGEAVVVTDTDQASERFPVRTGTPYDTLVALAGQVGVDFSDE
jgi:hypothetical protein